MSGQPEGAPTLNVEVERVVAAASDAMTDEMVTRLAATAGDAVELIDQVNRAGLARAIPALAQMVEQRRPRAAGRNWRGSTAPRRTR